MEEWDESEDGVIDGTCESCERKTLVQLNSDPFIAELNPEAENPPMWVCRTCFVNRMEDI